jgi:hypothetical protein
MSSNLSNVLRGYLADVLYMLEKKEEKVRIYNSGFKNTDIQKKEERKCS